MIRTTLAVMACSFALAGCVVEVPMDPEDRPIPTDAQSIAEGREIADAQCAVCHGLDQGEASRADARPLRYVLSDYDPKLLRSDLQGGIVLGHEDMPNFAFGPLGADVLLAYLVSIEEPPPQ